LPLLMFTNFETARLKQEAISAGVSALVSKTESVEVLISRLRALLGRVL
jgi:DNA-binding NarL/FixJ family response regulator